MCIMAGCTECVSDMPCPYGRGSCWACLHFPYGACGGEFTGLQIRNRKVQIGPLGARMRSACVCFCAVVWSKLRSAVHLQMVSDCIKPQDLCIKVCVRGLFVLRTGYQLNFVMLVSQTEVNM